MKHLNWLALAALLALAAAPAVAAHRADAPGVNYVLAQAADDPPPLPSTEAPSVTASPTADIPPPTATEVSTTGLLADLKELVTWILTGGAALLAGWITYWMKLDKDGKLNIALHAALERGAIIAAHRLGEQIDKLPQRVDLKNEIAAYAAGYAIENRGAAVKALGLSREKLKELAMAHVPLPPMRVVVPPPA